MEQDLEFRFSPTPGVGGGGRGERQVTGEGASKPDFTWQILLVVPPYHHSFSLFSNKTLIFAKMH